MVELSRTGCCTRFYAIAHNITLHLGALLTKAPQSPKLCKDVAWTIQQFVFVWSSDELRHGAAGWRRTQECSSARASSC